MSFVTIIVSKRPTLNFVFTDIKFLTNNHRRKMYEIVLYCDVGMWHYNINIITVNKLNVNYVNNPHHGVNLKHNIIMQRLGLSHTIKDY